MERDRLIQEVLQSWKSGELSGDAAMIVIHNEFYPAKPDEDDLKWAREELNKVKIDREKNAGEPSDSHLK